MNIQERFESGQATIDAKIKNKDLPKGVYAATGAVDVVFTRVNEIPAHVDAQRRVCARCGKEAVAYGVVGGFGAG